MKTAVVTGGSSGIGLAVVETFIERGDWRVVSVDIRQPASADERVRTIQADVKNPGEVDHAFDIVASEEGSIHALVNNAGIQRVGLTQSMAISAWNEVIATNLSGAFHCSQSAIRRFSYIGGAIVNVSSVAALLGLAGRGPYCAAKAGLLGLTRAMALELAARGVRVNAVAPGFTRTELISQGLADGSLQESWMTRRVPMARLARPSEIASAVHFLCSADASFITGHCLVVDGGWSVQGLPNTPEWLQTDAGASGEE